MQIHVLVASLFVFSYLVYHFFSSHHARRTATTSSSSSSSNKNKNKNKCKSEKHEEEKQAKPADEKDEIEQDPYINILPLHNFLLEQTPPIRNSPLKPRYHLTMALEKISLSEIVEMDWTYEERMRVRREIMEEMGEATMMCMNEEESKEAVRELYEWIFGEYLPRRFPTIYEVKKKTKRKKRWLKNCVSNELIPLHEPDPLAALKTLGGHVDTDFLFLLPSSPSSSSFPTTTTTTTTTQQQNLSAEEKAQPAYHLSAFICCFPSGFSLRAKLGLPLAAIHTPVPGYASKLEKSMNRFFARLPVGKAVKRSNWAITTDEKLFKEGGNHWYSDGIAKEKAKVRIENCRLRSERQTLFRLPRTGAIVFSFKTYQYRLEDVKREGYGEALAQAIDGLREGNVPEMAWYKREVVWGDAVKRFLRS
ncbi:hypothetical protein CERZMDRAFT_50004 [Cercospora zeae-maydis SCOH1-5]|uniref:Uncharacterized protein n=1 Tax=Cercospora zeae-maydis SCOH1-5 TaxID=717836 RepID=A0A6A6F0R2_9PEZI|nr:hypothetical protein CERZMDRAFT_50004 [Cercospora zeae-maydis SCOH1-5]